MLCCTNHFFEEVQSHWFLKRKASDEGKVTERICTWQAKLTRKDAKRRVAYLLLQACIIAGEVCSHPGSSLLGSPWLHNVVVALQICSGFVRLWGCASASQKSYKQNSREKKSIKTADHTGEVLGIFLHMPQFSLVFPGSVIRKIIIFIIIFLRVVIGTMGTNTPTKEDQGKGYFSYLLENFPGNHRLKSLFFRTLKTYRNHIKERCHTLSRLEN